MIWHVLHVKPRREKKLAEFCQLAELPCYLPLREQTRIYQRRRVTHRKTVFPGYLFAAFGDEGRLHLLKTNHIVRILTPRSEPQFLHQLEQIRMALAVDPTLGATTALTVGRWVRIIDGPFKGIEGWIGGFKGTTSVCLNVDMIGQAVKVLVEKEMLELMD